MLLTGRSEENGLHVTFKNTCACRQITCTWICLHRVCAHGYVYTEYVHSADTSLMHKLNVMYCFEARTHTHTHTHTHTRAHTHTLPLVPASPGAGTPGNGAPNGKATTPSTLSKTGTVASLVSVFKSQAVTTLSLPPLRSVHPSDERASEVIAEKCDCRGASHTCHTCKSVSVERSHMSSIRTRRRTQVYAHVPCRATTALRHTHTLRKGI